MTRTSWRRAMRATYALTEKFILLGIMGLSAAVFFTVIFSRTLTAPLTRLYYATRNVAEGKFDLQLPTQSRDEIGALSGSFNVMSAKIQDLISESMEKVRLEGELAIASTVQQNLIPPPVFDSPMIQIRSHYESASECGGDWWGFFGVGNKIAVLIADATGHGLPSALMTASARSCVSVLHKLAQEDPDFSFSPGAMLSFANRAVHDAASGKIMMTFFVGVIDLEKREIVYSSAGHNPPWIFPKAGGAPKSLVARGTRLGEKRDITMFEEKTVSFNFGDVLFLYTDGLVEGQNATGEQYGKKQTRKIIQASLAQGTDAALDALKNDFRRHNGGKVLDDDVTYALISLGPPAGAS